MAVGQEFSRTPALFTTVQEPLPRVVAVKLTTTASTPIFEASTDKNVTEAVIQLRVVNTSASAQTITVHWYDSSTATNFSIFNTLSIGAYTTLVDSDFRFRLGAGDAIKCTAGNINVLEVMLMITERGRSF